ncbi:Myxococcales GC_trans_RRR domain-containing protein/MYXO-CTERM domain-containing protein [Nannocystis exedens]|uniref:Myxococcales GC_trans_RRR domain-containing protein/MYXO-CTERM domain-containing protein n=1 Tax=Nannocystis exedens TaxID=54 RepID=A0A1I2CSL7_9BACT|nr:M23 family metallopeptidase [Nannocystis exedens]PCC68527.1 Murein DD-endopeptidase MepM [Nannocystis exedens]SFE71248.1 Myxococcales GC_trans_RRR domain-containing protein/MYXO-CTERM domain-containing protein [Nannocystis exedens]
MPARHGSSCKPLQVLARLAAVALVAAPAAAAHAAVCYQLPFPNPNLADGWGSTCCGRTSPHRGVDFPQASGTPIPAVADGVVALNQWSGCLGNVVVVQHADGMFSGYSHMVAASPLGVGTPVTKGQQVGQVGNTGSCSQGAHLHLTMAPAVNGVFQGTTVDPYAYIIERLECNLAPIGYLDETGCEHIVGWSQDPTAPDSVIPTHLYFDGPAGDPNAVGVAIDADVHRDDLCMAIGSCQHGFRMPTPLSVQDGQPHAVHAYGIDTQGGNNPELGSSPRTLQCPPPRLTGVRRRVASVDVLGAWQFSTFADMVTLSDAQVDVFELGIDIPAAPTLVRADDGSPEVWLLDGADLQRRRHVPDLAVAEAWHLQLDTAAVWPAAELLALQEAPPLRPRPTLVKGDGDAIWLLDVDLDPAPAGTAGESDSAGEPTTSHTDGDTGPGPGTDSSSSGPEGPASAGLPPGFGSDEGCGCASNSSGSTAWLGALVLLMGTRRRRAR